MNDTTSVVGVESGGDEVVVVAQSTLFVLGVLNVVVGILGAFLSLVLALATGLPLLFPERRKRYSSFNLYVCFLSASDLLLTGSLVYMSFWRIPWRAEGNTKNNYYYEDNDDNNDNDNYDPLWFVEARADEIVGPFCAVTNLYTNAFLTHEIYRMLKYSNLRKRYYPPTIRKVTKQAMISAGISGLVGSFDYFVVGTRMDDVGEDEAWKSKLNSLYYGFILIVCAALPLSVMVVIALMIWCQGLVRTTSSLYGGRMRILTFFFLRVVILDLAIWVPSTVGFSAQWFFEDPRTQVLAYWSSFLLVNTGCAVNFGLSLTKLDTRDLVLGFLKTVVCCRPYDTGANHASNRTSSIYNHNNNSNSRISSIGDDFSEDGGHDFFLGRLESLRSMRRTASDLSRRLSGTFGTGTNNEGTGAVVLQVPGLSDIESYIESSSLAIEEKLKHGDEKNAGENVGEETITTNNEVTETSLEFQHRL